MTTTSKSPEWFTVDRQGLAALLARRGPQYVLFELIQNAVDEDGVTIVDIEFQSIADRRGIARLRVLDDAPNGFADLTHSFTMFAPSAKKDDVEKRGRFNLGEKLVLAVCDTAEIVSTRGGYRFDKDGRHKVIRRTVLGSLFDAEIRMSRTDVVAAIEQVFSVLPPAGVTITINSDPIPYREPLHTFMATLPTEIAGEEGRMRATARQTAVSVYEPLGDETPMLYEMGIPVVESGDRWHVNISQKIPLNMDRDNVTPAYLRKVRTAVLNEMHDRLDADDATETWVKSALVDATPQAVQSVVTKLYGADAVVYDPSDPEANKLAVAQGRTVIPPRAFDKATWANVRETGMFRPAGQVTPSNSTLITNPNGQPPIPETNWTNGMRHVAAYAQTVGKTLLGRDITVIISRAVTGQRWQAAYGNGVLRFNVGQLGHRWFNEPNIVKIDALLIHEFAHERSSDHLSSAFYDACCDLGARMKHHAAALTDAFDTETT